MKRFLTILWAGLGVMGSIASAASFYVNYDAKVPEGPLRLNPVSILHQDAQVDLSVAHAAGNQVLAYLSVGEIASDASYRAKALERGLRLRGRNELWGSDILDLSDAGWIELLVGEVAAEAVAKGYDGFFLDTLDSIAPTDQAAGVALVKKLRELVPTGMILANRGFTMLPALGEAVDGVLVESVFGTFDFERRIYHPVAPEVSEILTHRLREFEQSGLQVFVLDYADPDDEAAARGIARQIEDRGWFAFVSTPALRGAALAPWREVPRRIFSFYGNMALDPVDQRKWPVDSFTYKSLQAPLEWLGYELDYGKVEVGVPLPELGAETMAVVLPRGWEFPISEEPRVMDWLLQQKESGKKILVWGGLPFDDDIQRRRFIKAFGLGGTGMVILPVRHLKQIESDPAIMNGAEVKNRLLPSNFQDLQAPQGSRLMHSVTGQTPDGQVVRVDALFATSWGGMALDPFITLQRPDFRELWKFDIFAYLEAVLGRVNAPIPDTTTRMGRRMLMSHIDGDGFINKSETSVGKFSSEVVRDEILKRYPIPVTVSVIEAEVRGMVDGVDPGLTPKFEEIARDIFKLPNVEVASHSFSHPFTWIENDRTASLYKRTNLKLRVPYARMDLRREIEGSVTYIDRELAPPDKKVEVFLWSGNCRPPPAALRWVDRLGLEAMNGGDTLISRKVPTLNAVAPRSISWGDQIQVLAPAQNENVYTNDWEGPFYGTFVNVVETFERTESPRRLKPVDIYYHFYSADYFSSLRALHVIHDWAMGQELHAIKVSDYVKLAHDSRRTSIHDRGDRTYALVNAGKLQTFRVPQDWGARIDLTASTGVLGWTTAQGETYVHTSGLPVSIIRLVPEGERTPSMPYLDYSTGPLVVHLQSPDAVEFTVRDLRPVTVRWGGFRPAQEVEVQIDGASSLRRASATGEVVLKLGTDNRVAMTGK